MFIKVIAHSQVTQLKKVCLTESFFLMFEFPILFLAYTVSPYHNRQYPKPVDKASNCSGSWN